VFLSYNSSPDCSEKLFADESLFLLCKKAPEEAFFVTYKNGLNSKNLKRKAGPASKT
jgi:hypothetical protein